MVVQEQEMVSTEEEVIVVDSPSTLLQLPDGQQQPNKDLVLNQRHRHRHHHHHHHYPLSSLGPGRQSSIYSLTLDELQHTLSESGKNFGSMNMDEFLASIWTAEENQNQNQNQSTYKDTNSSINNPKMASSCDSKGIPREPSLPRQGSLSLPAPLCRKTVDEVWSEIHGNGNGQGNDVNGRNGNVQKNPDSTHRQPTFGEMTLEDFLIKAGVVQEQPCTFPPMPAQQQQQLGFYQGGNGSTNSSAGVGFASRPIAVVAAGGCVGASYPQPAQVGVYGGRLGNGSGGGYMATGAIVGPLSPVSNSEGMVAGVGGGAENQYGLMDMAGLRGRKRIIDGPVEKVIERRQRRMIKNRESAARSRARKQAYTVELEAELNQLKEENQQLKQALAELENKRRQQCFEETRMKTRTRAQKDKERLRMMRRNLSCPL